jgi:cation:H+ antiporter
MWIGWAAVAAGLTLLVLGADRFVDGAAASARHLGVSPLVIGLTVVGFATSAPEMLVSALAAWDGKSGLAVGNALGSNIANVGLVLGIAALARPLSIRSSALRRELPALLLVTVAVLAALGDAHLGRLDGVALLAALLLLLVWMHRVAVRTQGADPLVAEVEQELAAPLSPRGALLRLAIGLALLLGGARLLVVGGVSLAEAAGISDLVIGLTVVAVGTSLPEVAATVAGVLKGEDDIAIGNVIGSNMFNLLGVIGIAGVIHPAGLPSEALTRDYPLMLGMTVVLGAFAVGVPRGGRVDRVEGATLLLTYAGYLLILYLTAS